MDSKHGPLSSGVWGRGGGDKRETQAGEGIGVKIRVLMMGKVFVGGDDSVEVGE